MEGFLGSDLMFSCIAIFILILFSGFFSGSETALTAISKVRIHKLSQKGYKKAKHIKRLRDKKDSLIGSILIGNNLVNILASSLATKISIDLFAEQGVVYATIFMTVIVVIFAEILPKTYALYHTEQVSLIVAPIIRVFVKIFTPFTISLEFMTSRLASISKKEGKSDLISAIEELQGTIELHHNEGGVLKQDKDMLDSILDLATTEVSAVMTHRKNMFTVDLDDDNEKILEEISKAQFTRVPIWQGEQDNIVGVLHAKDVLKTTIFSTKETKEIDFMKIANEPWFIPENRTLREQLFAFKKERNHFAIVVDEYGSVQGVITLEDILEEIVGEIKDEYDKGEENYYKKLSENEYVLDGVAAVRDINRDLDWALPENDAATVAGLLINAAEKIPERGEVFEYFDYNFEVMEKSKNQITKLKLGRLNRDIHE